LSLSLWPWATLAVVALLFQATEGQRPPSTFRGGTNVVLVDATVVGRDGRDVEDLGASDFEILDDGTPVPLISVRRISGWDRNGAQELLPIRTAADEEREAARDDVRLVGIFLDEYHIGRFEPLKVVPALVDFVRALPPADLVAIYFPGLSARDIRYTRDREAAIRTIRTFQGRQGIYVPAKYPFEEQHMRHPVDIERVRMQVTVSSIIGAVVHLDTLKEGRKTLLVVSQRLDDVIEMSRAANQSNVAVYTIDPQGLGMSANRAAQDWLRVLAEETGGRAFVDTNNIRGGLSQVLDDFGGYYLLGYVSPRANDGRFHVITARVKRPQVVVHARKGYWALTPAQAAQVAAEPAVVPKPVQDALATLADAMRPDRAEPGASAPAASVRDASVLGTPTITAMGTADGDRARLAFTRTERIVVRAAVEADSSVEISARLLSRLGQTLTVLPVSRRGRSCEVTLALGGLGPGDYVIELSAQKDRVEVSRFAAFRVLR